jgi:hypothetical protein
MEGHLSEIPTEANRSPKPFFDGGGQGGRIISDY